MRTPPPIRTWGQPPVEIVIRQSEPISADEFFESVSWAGMELFDGWLMPKGAGLSNEEKQLDDELWGRADENLESYLTEVADYLPVIKAPEKRRLEVGYIVISASQFSDALAEELEQWFAFGYREVWVFRPWYRTLDVYTPSRKQQFRGEMFESPYLKSGKRQWQLPLTDVWEFE